MSPLQLVKLTKLMERTSGVPSLTVGLIDGPVLTGHPDLEPLHLKETGGSTEVQCAQVDGEGCRHGTFIAGILFAKRGSAAPAICPDCTVVIRPIFLDLRTDDDSVFGASPLALVTAMLECIEAGARIINLSLTVLQPRPDEERLLADAITRAAGRGVLIVAAAGNQRVLGSSVLTRHPWVIPVVACDLAGKPTDDSNLAHSIACHGLRAPGDEIRSLSPDEQPTRSGGTSVAAPFVTGAAALLWSEFPKATAEQVRVAITQGSFLAPRASIIPSLLDAERAYQFLLET